MQLDPSLGLKYCFWRALYLLRRRTITARRAVVIATDGPVGKASGTVMASKTPKLLILPSPGAERLKVYWPSDGAVQPHSRQPLLYPPEFQSSGIFKCKTSESLMLTDSPSACYGSRLQSCARPRNVSPACRDTDWLTEIEVISRFCQK